MRLEKVTDVRMTVIDRIICNQCGQEIGKNEFGYFDEHLHIEKEWGFGSEFDGDTHTFDLCQICFKSMMKTMAIQPEIKK